jgi:hypothetical protein
MNQKGFFISKTLFFSVVGTAILLLLATAFLIKEKNSVQEKTRQLIIQNDSVMSVNIVLSDSLKGKITDSDAKNSRLPKPNLKK